MNSILQLYQGHLYSIAVSDHMKVTLYLHHQA